MVPLSTFFVPQSTLLLSKTLRCIEVVVCSCVSFDNRLFVAVTDYRTLLFCFDSTRHIYYGTLRRRRVGECTLNTSSSPSKRPPLWSRGNIVASHLAYPGSIPGHVSFPGWGFSRSFSSTIRQMSGNVRPNPSSDITDHHNHKKSFHYRCKWPQMLTHPETPHILYCLQQVISLYTSQANIPQSFSLSYIGLTSPSGLTIQNPVGYVPVGEHRIWVKILDRYTRAGLPQICVPQNVRSSAWDNTGKNTKDIHPVPGWKLKFPAGWGF